MENEQIDDAVACAKCSGLPTDVLILTCDHNLCLRCASENLKRLNRRNNSDFGVSQNSALQQQNSFQTVVCDLCQIATVLDPASASELLNMEEEIEPIQTTEGNMGNNFSEQSAPRDFQRAENPHLHVHDQEEQFVRNNEGEARENVRMNLEKVRRSSVGLRGKRNNPALPPQSQRYTGGSARPLTQQLNQNFGSYNNLHNFSGATPVGAQFTERNFEIQSQASSRVNGRTSPFQNFQPSKQHRQSGISQIGGMSSYGGSQLPGGGAPCPHHPDEFVSYFCFSCQSPPICAECVIHGAHQGHQVQTIRKALPEISENIEQLINTAGQKIEELSIIASKMEAKKREIHDDCQTLKMRLAQQFEDLHLRLDAKERELTLAIEESHGAAQSEVDYHARNLKARSQQLQETEEMVISQKQNSDEVQLLQFYADKFADVYEEILMESDTPHLRTVDYQNQARQRQSEKALSTFFADVEVIQSNIGMLVFDQSSDQVEMGPPSIVDSSQKQPPKPRSPVFRSKPPVNPMQKQQLRDNFHHQLRAQTKKVASQSNLAAGPRSSSPSMQVKRSGHPDSNRGPPDSHDFYSRALCQLSYVRTLKVLTDNLAQDHANRVYYSVPHQTHQSHQAQQVHHAHKTHPAHQVHQHAAHHHQPPSQQTRNPMSISSKQAAAGSREGSSNTKISSVIQNAQKMVNDLSRKQLPKTSSRSKDTGPARFKETAEESLTNLEKYKLKLKAQKQQEQEQPSRSPSDLQGEARSGGSIFKGTVQDSLSQFQQQSKPNNGGSYGTYGSNGQYGTNQFSSLEEPTASEQPLSGGQPLPISKSRDGSSSSSYGRTRRSSAQFRA